MPKPKTNLARTDAQRANRNAASYRNFTVIGCRLDRATAERYKTFCEAHGTNPSADIKSFILSRLGEQADPAAPESAPAAPKTE